MENRDEPINPCIIKGRQGFANLPTIPNREVYGLTKREYFAGLAMLGRNSCQSETYNGDIEGIAKYAVEMADALLIELKKK